MKNKTFLKDDSVNKRNESTNEKLLTHRKLLKYTFFSVRLILSLKVFSPSFVLELLGLA